MNDISPQSMIDKPAIYRITVKGWLDASRTDWFDGMAVTVAKDEAGKALTTLVGPVTDQPALHGLLTRLRDLGLSLLEVHCLET